MRVVQHDHSSRGRGLFGAVGSIDVLFAGPHRVDVGPLLGDLDLLPTGGLPGVLDRRQLAQHFTFDSRGR